MTTISHNSITTISSDIVADSLQEANGLANW